MTNLEKNSNHDKDQVMVEYILSRGYKLCIAKMIVAHSKGVESYDHMDVLLSIFDHAVEPLSTYVDDPDEDDYDMLDYDVLVNINWAAGPVRDIESLKEISECLKCGLTSTEIDEIIWRCEDAETLITVLQMARKLKSMNIDNMFLSDEDTADLWNALTTSDMLFELIMNQVSICRKNWATEETFSPEKVQKRCEVLSRAIYLISKVNPHTQEE